MQREEFELTISRNRKATIVKINALEMMQATSYCGESPSGAVLNMACAVCAVSKIDGKAVNPCSNKSEFSALAQELDSDDMTLIGMAQAARSNIGEEQKKALEAMGFGNSSPSRRSRASRSKQPST
jgi:hypothetical protein